MTAAAHPARPPRHLWVLLHRWVGLVLAGFLLIAGLTGALLAWYHELDAALNPQLMRVEAPAAGAKALDPLVLREQVQRAHPAASVRYVDLAHKPGESAVFSLEAIDPAVELANDEVFVDPYTGAVLGARKWGDIGQGTVNLMPFIYRLHYSLALGTVGTYAFGIVALLWTLDCFVGAYLTLPRRKPGGAPWWRRWAPAWRVRAGGGATRLNFDLHRAGGLWPWAMLFVLAWSSVAFNLGEVYRPVMRTLLTMQPNAAEAAEAAPALPPAEAAMPVDWQAGLRTGRAHMAALAARERFTVESEQGFFIDAAKGLFHYRVRSSRDVAERYGSTAVVFSAHDGRLVGSHLPTGKAAGDTVTTWLMALHMAAMWGLPMKIFVCVIGLVVAMLSVTGVVIWVKKRRGRRAMAARPAARQPVRARAAGPIHT